MDELRYGNHPRQNLLLRRPTVEPRGVVLFWHGGGWVEGSAEDGLSLLSACRDAGYLAASSGYRLAPEHPYPAAVDDAVAATVAVLSLPESAGLPWYVAGYSAGAQLAGLLVLDPARLREVGVEAGDCAGLIGLSGVYDIARAYRLKWMRDRWVRPTFGDEPEVHRAASPLSHAGPGAPRTLLLNAQLDWGLHRHAEALAAALRAADVPVEQRVLPDRNHVTILSRLGPADEPATRRVLEFLGS